MAPNPRFAKPAGCDGCSLASIGWGFAPAVGPVGARLTFIGEALGFEEGLRGEPFVGSAGGVLSRVLHRAGIDRSHVRIANVVSCRPPNDYLVGAPWEHQAIARCRQYLQPVLDTIPTDAVVIPLGATALQTVLGLAGVEGVTVKDFHGTVSRDPSDRYWVVPSFHPSHLQRGAMNLLDVVTQNLSVASRISQRGFQRSPVQLVVDPHPEWFAQWCEDHAARAEADPDGVHLACDTEFLEKSGGADESEVTAWSAESPITRINGANTRDLGWTVPHKQPYIGIFGRLLDRLRAIGGWTWFWNKYADVDHLRAAGYGLDGLQMIDAMWLWHYLQSDLPRGLGFVAPMASDFGAWKHWGKDKAKEGVYAAADGVQTFRVAMWLLDAAQKSGLWDVFFRDWHERDTYVLRPAHAIGVPIDRPALEAFHVELQQKLAGVLARLKTTAAQGVLKPKGGYSRKPKATACRACSGTGLLNADEHKGNCPTCHGSGEVITPPASILGTSKKGGGEAKQQYMLEGVQLVEREIEVEINGCTTCGAEDVGAKHRCPKPRASKRKGDKPVLDAVRPVAVLERRTVRQARYFWQLPFNPDAPAQILAYLAQQGIDAPIDKKRGTATTNKKALQALKTQHADDPFFQLQMDWKAVQKVDATYAVGTLARLDRDDRVHPEILPKPSTLRDSCANPNVQNCVRVGTLIEILRDAAAHPHGTPIEQVRVGDWAYTFDGAGDLTLRRVLAVIDNGLRPVVRVYWRGSRRRSFVGFVDLTADHLVRLTSGAWKPAGQLAPGDRVLSLARIDDGQGYELLLATGKRSVREHRWVYMTLHPDEPPPPHTHHVNGNTKDNRPENLTAIAVGEHFRHHNTGAGNPKWHSEWPLDALERRRCADRESRARRRAADPEGFKRLQRDRRRALRDCHLHNHEIVRVVALPDPVFVYDLTIEGTHCFIAGEIAVHNCIGDKMGAESLAAGFRRVVVARDGVPADVSADEHQQWEQRWS